MMPNRESAKPRAATRTAAIDQRFFERSLHILALSSLAVAQPVLDLLSRHPEFFVVRRFDRFELVALLVTLLFVVPAPFIMVEALLLRARRSLQKAVHLLFVWFFGVLLWLLVLTRAEGLSPTVVFAIALFTAGVGSIVYARTTVARSFVGLLAIALVAVPAVFAFNPQVSRLLMKRQATDLDLPPLKTRAPIIFVIFDEFNLSVLLDEDFRINRHRFPNFAALADRSTWYRGAVTAAGNTAAAVPAILTGTEPASDKMPSVNDYPRNLFTLFGGSHRMWVDEPVSVLCPPELDRENTVRPSRLERAAELLPDLAIVYAHLIIPHAWKKELPSISSGWSDFGGGAVNAPSSASPLNQKGFFRKAVRAVRQDRRPTFDHFVELASAASDLELYFTHLMLPHRPWELLPDGRLYPGGGKRIPCISRQGWCSDRRYIALALQRLILQTMYVDTVVGRLIVGLDASGRFDETLIVLTADHGIGFTPGEHPRILSEGNAHGVLPVPLFVKAPHQTQSRIIGSRVSTLDVLPTILDLLGEEAPWPMDGVSRVKGGGPNKPPFPVFTKRGGTVEMDSSLLKTKRGFVKNMLRLFGDGSDPDSLYCFGRYAELCGRSTEELEILPGMSWRARIQNAESFETVDLDGSELPALLLGAVRQPGAARTPQTLLVALNGAVVGTTISEVMGKRWQPFSVVLPPSAFRDDRNTVELFRVAGKPTSPVLHALAID